MQFGPEILNCGRWPKKGDDVCTNGQQKIVTIRTKNFVTIRTKKFVNTARDEKKMNLSSLLCLF